MKNTEPGKRDDVTSQHKAKGLLIDDIEIVMGGKGRGRKQFKNIKKENYMKKQTQKTGVEMITVLYARDRIVEHINELVGAKIRTDGPFADPINEFVKFLELKEIAFVEQISVAEISEFCVKVRTHESEEDARILIIGVGAFIYLCVSRNWVKEELALLWNGISKHANSVQADPCIGLN